MPLSVKLPELPKLLPRPINGGASRRMRPPKPINCLNCGQSLSGKFCSNCGQEGEDHRTALWPLVHDALGEFIRWDSKLVKTIVPLLVRPGFLTNEYNSGKRVSYISPFKMYLTVSLIFFLLVASQSNKQHGLAIVSANTSQPNISLNVGNSHPSSDPKENKNAERALQLMRENAGYAKKADIDLASSKNWQKTPMLPFDKSLNIEVGRTKIFTVELPITVQAFDALQSNPNYPHRYSPFVRAIIERIYAMISQPDLLRKNMLDLLPKMAFCLIPVFALSLYPLYRRTNRYYVEHFVFALHNHAFVFIAIGLAMLLPDAISDWILPIVMVYLYASMLVVYKQHWFKTLLKYFFVSVTYAMILGVSTVLTLLIAVWLT